MGNNMNVMKTVLLFFFIASVFAQSHDEKHSTTKEAEHFLKKYWHVFTNWLRDTPNWWKWIIVVVSGLALLALIACAIRCCCRCCNCCSCCQKKEGEVELLQDSYQPCAPTWNTNEHSVNYNDHVA